MKKIILLFFVFFHFSSFSQKKQVGSIFFSWNQIGDITFIIKYKDEEIHPLASWHKHSGGYETKQAQSLQEKVVHSGKLMGGKFYRTNKITFSFWDYFKSFFITPEQVDLQQFTLFADGSESYVGPLGKTKSVFMNHGRRFFVDFQKLQEVGKL